jgi:hypothetical protein
MAVCQAADTGSPLQRLLVGPHAASMRRALEAALRHPDAQVVAAARQSLDDLPKAP